MQQDLKILPLIFKANELDCPPLAADYHHLWEKVQKSLDHTFDKFLCKILVLEFHQLKKQLANEDTLHNSIYSESYLRERLKTRYSSEWTTINAILVNAKTQFTLLICRLHADRVELNQIFQIPTQDALIDIQWGVSDLHNAGEQVHILSFTSGDVVYKPRSGKMLSSYNQFLQKINQEITYPHYIQSTLDKSDYHWVEFIQHRKCKSTADTEKYYYRLGSLMAISYGLCATDFHYENLIACGEYPVLIDLDSLIEPAADLSNENQSVGSVMSSGLLPFQMWNESTKAFSDVSGCSINTKLISKTPLLNIETNSSWTLKVTEFVISPKNHPQTERPSHHFLEFIENGFIETYLTFIQLKKSEDWNTENFLSIFQNLPTRFMNRHTVEYENARNGQLHPSVCLDSNFKQTYFEGFHKTPNFFKNHRNLILDEIESLKKLSIPYYWSDTSSTHLFRKNNGTQGVTQNFFEQSGFERLTQRWSKKINKFDLIRQLWFIRSSLFLTSDSKDSFYWNPTDWKLMAVLFRSLSGNNNHQELHQWVTIDFTERRLIAIPPEYMEDRKDLIKIMNMLAQQEQLDFAAESLIWNSFFIKNSIEETQSSNIESNHDFFKEILSTEEISKLDTQTLSLTTIAKILKHLSAKPECRQEIRKFFNKQFAIDLENSQNLLTPEHRGGIWLLMAFSITLNGLNDPTNLRSSICLK